MRELKKDDVVAGFVVKGRVGSGGMGEVHLVHDPKLDVDRALKLIALSGPGFKNDAAEAVEYRQRFEREARILAKLRHPNIIPVHAFGELDADAFLVMTYFPSRDAKKWLHEEKPSLERVVKVARQLASALAHAHAADVLHRDIKLTNVLVGADDEAMLIDFGLAKGKLDANLTRTGRSMGTFSYLAPEYVKASTVGKPTHTVQTDLWALGCVLYALTCRRPAFHDKDDLRLLGMIQRAEFAPVKMVRPETPARWAAVIERLMEPDIAKRVQSANALLALLADNPLSDEPLHEGAVAAQPPELDADDDDADPGVVPASVVEVLEQRNASADDAQLEPSREFPDAAAPEGAAPSESLFSHPSARATTPTTERSPTTGRVPRFDLPQEAAATSKTSARRGLLFPVAAAAAVLVVGGSLIAWSGHAHAHGDTHRINSDDVEQRRTRAERELAAVEEEHERRAEPLAAASEPALPLNASLQEVSKQSAPVATPALVSGRAATATPVPPVPRDDPWAKRYGTRTSFNTSSSPASTLGAAQGAATPAKSAAGVRIPATIAGAVTSAPAGPVIATVEEKTTLGTVELPVGTEVHGRIGGVSGSRILLEFAFALVNGQRVPLKGVALGTDGRVGIAATKNLGGASGLAAGAAGAAAQAALDAAAAVVGGVGGAAIQGAAGAAVAKTGRIDNEEAVFVTASSPRFLIYVDE